MPQSAHGDPSEKIDVAFALRIPELCTFTAVDHERWLRVVGVEVGPRLLEERVICARAHRRGNYLWFRLLFNRGVKGNGLIHDFLNWQRTLANSTKPWLRGFSVT